MAGKTKAAEGSRRFRVRDGISLRRLPAGMTVEQFQALSRAEKDALTDFDVWADGDELDEAALPAYADVAGWLASGHLEVI